MVSSTFYDLKQVRADLARFITDELGYIALLSELPSFPVDPDLDTMENCRHRVEQNADILVLIIGGRYGSIDVRTDKSITNIEYSTARAKGIPVYVFVDKQILSMVPVWQSNPEADFSNVVDTPRLFDFVSEIRTAEGVWVFPFEVALEIIETLRMQLAHLFGDALQLRLRLGTEPFPAYLKGLATESLRIALERPVGWEYLLYLQCWIDEVSNRSDLRRQYDLDISVGFAEEVTADSACGWLQTRLHELTNMIASLKSLVDTSPERTFGKPGEPGDLELIVWTARMIGQLFEDALQWALRVRRARVEPPFDAVAKELSRFPEDIIEKLCTFPQEVQPRVSQAIASAASGKPQVIQVTLAVDLSNQEAFHRALEQAQSRYIREQELEDDQYGV